MTDADADDDADERGTRTCGATDRSRNARFCRKESRFSLGTRSSSEISRVLSFREKQYRAPVQSASAATPHVSPPAIVNTPSSLKRVRAGLLPLDKLARSDKRFDTLQNFPSARAKFGRDFESDSKRKPSRSCSCHPSLTGRVPRISG